MPVSSPIFFDAQNQPNFDEIKEIVAKNSFPEDAVWTVDPNQAYGLAQHWTHAAGPEYKGRKLFSDSFSGFKLDIQWEHATGQFELRDKDGGILFQAINLPCVLNLTK